MTDDCAAEIDVHQGEADLVESPAPLPRALRHGAYAETLLPDEDAAQFEALRAQLIAEFNPAGPLEDDIVAALARLIWRKQNLTSFRVPGATRYTSLMSNLDLEDRLDRLIDRCASSACCSCAG